MSLRPARFDWSYRYISEAGFVWGPENKAQFDAYMFDEHTPKPACRILKPNITADSFGATLSYPLVRRADIGKH